MLVSHTQKFIYTKTAKTAGTTVENYFLPYCLPGTPEALRQAKSANGYEGPEGMTSPIGHPPSKCSVRLPHMAAAQIKRETGDEVWNDYFKFCVVRNPFDKMVSGFYYFDELRNTMLGQGESGQAVDSSASRRSALIDLLPEDGDPITRFRGWLKNGAIIHDRNKYFIAGKVCVDYFIRFESLVQGIAEVCEKLSVPFDESRIRKLKGRFRPRQHAVEDFYDQASIDIIRKYYKFELNTFGYYLR